MSAFGTRSVELAARIAEGYYGAWAPTDLIGRYRERGGKGPAIGELKVCWDDDEDRAVRIAHSQPRDLRCCSMRPTRSSSDGCSDSRSTNATRPRWPRRPSACCGVAGCCGCTTPAVPATPPTSRPPCCAPIEHARERKGRPVPPGYPAAHGDRRSHRGGLGRPHAARAGRALAGPGGPASRGGRDGGGRRPLGAVRVRAVQQRLRLRHRRVRRPHGGGAGAGDRRGEPRPAGPEGPLRVLAVATAGPAHAAAGPGGRPAGRDRLGHRDGADRGALPQPAGGDRPALARLLHQRPAVRRGVLHPRRHREGRPRHPAHGRQHPAVHGHGRRRTEGELRLRRAAGQLHRRRALRRDLPVRAQHGRDADGAVGAGARPGARRRPAADRRRGPAPDGGRPGRGRDRRGAPRSAARHQPGVDERAGP